MTLVEYPEKGNLNENEYQGIPPRKISNASDNVFESPTLRKTSDLSNALYVKPPAPHAYNYGINPLLIRNGRQSLTAGQHGRSHSPPEMKRISLSRNEGVDSSLYTNGRAPPRDEDRRPSGASDSELYEHDSVWQMRPDGQEYTPEHTPHPQNSITMPAYAGEDVV